MSGRELIESMRSSGQLPSQPRQFPIVDLLLVTAIIVAVATAGYFALGSKSGGPRAPTPQTMVASGSSGGDAAVAWTPDDTNACKARGRAEANAVTNDVPEGSLMPANPAVTEGYAGISTVLECHMTVKAGRLCNPAERAVLVAEINDYLGRTDLVASGLALQGAPMQVMGGFFGGEMAAGSDIYNMERDATFNFMKGYQNKVTSALRKLARDGLLSPSDFAGFMGGVPEVIKRMFGTATAERNPCT